MTGCQTWRYLFDVASFYLKNVITTKTNHAKRNATGYAYSIEALYELSCWDGNQEIPLTLYAKSILDDLDGDAETDPSENLQESITNYAREMPLSVRIRSDWHNPGEAFTAAEFEILLSTGGPACRIIGELDSGSVAWQSGCRPVLQHQDWFKPWIEASYDIDTNALLWFCEQFYYGE